MSKPPVFFLAFANERSQQAGYLRNLPEEARQLEAALSKARQSGLCELIVRHNVTAEEVFNTFQSDEYRDRIAVFHFAGHANGYQLLLESSSGASEAANAGGLAHLLGQQQGLQLVFLNGCSTMAQSDGLLKAGIPMVISTTETIDDQIATRFAQCFYAGLGNGATLKRAYRVAEARIKISQTPKQPKPSSNRGITLEAETDQAPVTWPWQVRVRPGSETVLQWNLPEAAGNPLFGLPALPPQDLPPSPFRHLRTFRREHAAVFFGRGALIRTLYDRITRPDTAPIILFYGQSGVGKSSVLEAGLLPRLQSHYQLKSLRRNQAQGVWQTLCDGLNAETTGTALQAAWLDQEQQCGQPLVVVFDQLEEVFTRRDPEQPEELETLMRGLQAVFGQRARRPLGKLILSYRKEWLAEIEKKLSNHHLPCCRVFVEPLDQAGILEAITGPTNTEALQQYYGLTLEPGLADTITHDLLADRESPIASVLQILLTRMWQQARSAAQPCFDAALYQTLKRDGLLLNDFLDQQFNALQQQSEYAEAVHSGLLLDVLTFYTTARGTANERNESALLAQYAHQRALCPALVEQCKANYLLVSSASESHDSADQNRLGHDALAPLIRERFETSDRPGQRARRILESRAVEWQGEHAGTPLDAADLALVEQGTQGMRVWTEDEQGLVAASQQQRRKQQRQRRLWRTMGVLAIGLILATTALTGWQWRVAEQQKTKAQSEQAKAEQQSRLSWARQLAAQAKIAFDTGTGEGLLHSSLLAIESLKQAHTTQGTLAMTQAEALLPYAVSTLPTGSCHVNAVAFAPNGQWLATGEAGKDCNQARLWNPKTGEVIRTFKHDYPVTGLTFNPDSSVLATRTGDNRGFWAADMNNNTARLWKTNNGEEIMRTHHEDRIHHMEFSMRGIRFITAGDDHTIRVFDTETWQKVIQLKHNDSIYAVNMSPDGTRLAARSGTIPVWNPNTGGKLYEIEHELAGKIVDKVEFSIDGSHLITLGRDGLLKMWDAISGKEIKRIDFDSYGGDLAGSNYSNTEFNHNFSKLIKPTRHSIRILDINMEKRFIQIPLPADDSAALTRFISNERELLGLTGEHPPRDNMTARIWTISDRERDKKEIVRLPGSVSLGRGNGYNDIITINSDDSRISTIVDGKARISTIKLDNIDVSQSNKDMIRDWYNPDSQSIIYVNYTSKKVIIKDALSGEVIAFFTMDQLCSDCFIMRAKISSDKKYIIFQLSLADSSEDKSLDKTPQLWSLEPSQLIAKFPHDYPADITDFSIDTSQVAIRTIPDTDNIVYLWNVASRAKHIELHHPLRVKKLKYIGRRLLVTSCEDNVIRIWNTDTSEEVKKFKNSNSFRLNLDDSKLLILSDQEIRVLDSVTWNTLSILPQKSEVNSVLFSPDHTRLAIKNADNLVTVWDTRKWEIIRQLRLSPGTRLSALNQDGSLLIVTNLIPARQRSIWDIQTGEELVRKYIPFGSFGPRVFGFSQDGRYWLTGGKPDYDPQKNPWQTQDLIASLCTRLPRNFTQKEWNQYMGDTPYQTSCDNLPAL